MDLDGSFVDPIHGAIPTKQFSVYGSLCVGEMTPILRQFMMAIL